MNGVKFFHFGFKYQVQPGDDRDFTKLALFEPFAFIRDLTEQLRNEILSFVSSYDHSL